MQSAVDSQNHKFTSGSKFGSFEDLQEHIKLLEHTTKNKFFIKDSRTLTNSNVKRAIDEKLKYCKIMYSCIHGGGTYRPKGTGIRRTSTFKMNCPVFIRFKPTQDGRFLEVSDSCLEHKGHDLSEKVPIHNLELAKKEKDTANSALELNSNRKTLQKKVHRPVEKTITLQDIQNIKQCFKEKSNELEQCFKLLTETYILDSSEKRKRGSVVINNLLNLMCLSSNSSYLYKMECLKRIEELWRQGEEITVDVAESGKECEDIEHQEIQVELEVEEPSAKVLHSEIQQYVGDVDTFTDGQILELPIYMKHSRKNDSRESVNIGGVGISDNENIEAVQSIMTVNIEECSNIVRPAKVIKRSRPKDSKVTTIGLKKKHCVMPKKFMVKTLEEKQLQILNELTQNKNLIHQCLSSGRKICSSDIIYHHDVWHTLLDPEVDMQIIKDYIEPDTFSEILEDISTISDTYQWNCPICHLEIHDKQSICCDSCLKWHHFACAKLHAVPNRQSWFCINCCS